MKFTLGSLYHITAPPVTLYATWNPADRNAEITLSGGNLTATKGVQNAWRSLRSTSPKASGKFYVEFQITQGSFCLFGVANASAALTTFFSASNDSVVYAYDGTVKLNNINIASGYASFGLGNRVQLAIDKDNSRLWVRVDNGVWNGSAGNNPATNTGGLDISAITGSWMIGASLFSWSPSDVCVLRVSPPDWTGSAPAGFSGWLL